MVGVVVVGETVVSFVDITVVVFVGSGVVAVVATASVTLPSEPF